MSDKEKQHKQGDLSDSGDTVAEHEGKDNPDQEGARGRGETHEFDREYVYRVKDVFEKNEAGVYVPTEQHGQSPKRSESPEPGGEHGAAPEENSGDGPPKDFFEKNEAGVYVPTEEYYRGPEGLETPGVEEEPGCEPEEEPAKGKRGKGKGAEKNVAETKPATQTATTAKPAPTSTTFTFPFYIRYASEVLFDLAGFVDGQKYTSDQIKELLIQNGYTEFRDMQPAFHHNPETNTLVITIKGSVKGGTQIDEGLLLRVQAHFYLTYHAHRTEDRVLIYRNSSGATWMVWPDAERTPGKAKLDAPLTITVSGEDWDLVFDLHSHHVMGAFWSPTDDANERLRGITFGVFSWKGDQEAWLFRRFTGQGYVSLSDDEVVGRG